MDFNLDVGDNLKEIEIPAEYYSKKKCVKILTRRNVTDV